MTDKIMPQIEDWHNRPLSEVYPVLYIDAIHYSVRDNGVIHKLAAYVILGSSQDGYKEVLTIEIGENESAKYWLFILNGLKNRGVKDILIILCGRTDRALFSRSLFEKVKNLSKCVKSRTSTYRM